MVSQTRVLFLQQLLSSIPYYLYYTVRLAVGIDYKYYFNKILLHEI